MRCTMTTHCCRHRRKVPGAAALANQNDSGASLTGAGVSTVPVQDRTDDARGASADADAGAAAFAVHATLSTARAGFIHATGFGAAASPAAAVVAGARHDAADAGDGCIGAVEVAAPDAGHGSNHNSLACKRSW